MNRSRRSGRKPRPVTQPAKPASGPAAAVPESRSKWSKTQVAVAASGWFFAAIVYVLDAPAKVNSFFSEKDSALHNVAAWYWDFQRFNGQWTDDEACQPNRNMVSEDGASAPKDKGSIQLSLEDDGSGQFDGEIVTSQLATHYAWSRVQVSGHFGFAGFQGEVWDIIDNEKRTLAYFTVTPSDEFGGNALVFKADKNFDRVVPSSATLWRSSCEMSGGEMGSEFKKLLQESTQKTLRPGPAPSHR